MKNHADALQRPWPPFWIFLGGVGLNIALNWVLIYGNLGCPALGFEGAAWATLIARTAILGAMLGWLLRAKDLREWMPRRWLVPPEMREIRRLLSIGLPASIQMLFEVSAFSVVGLLMGRFGPDAMAAHQIAITLAGTAFMLPLGLSMALTVRIGEAHGAGELARLRPIAVSGWLLVTAYALLGATFFLICGRWLAKDTQAQRNQRGDSKQPQPQHAGEQQAVAATCAHSRCVVRAARVGREHRNRRQHPDAKHKRHMKQRVGKGQRRQIANPEMADHHRVDHPEQHLAELPDHQGQRQTQREAGFVEQIHARLAVLDQSSRLSMTLCRPCNTPSPRRPQEFVPPHAFSDCPRARSG